MTPFRLHAPAARAIAAAAILAMGLQGCASCQEPPDTPAPAAERPEAGTVDFVDVTAESGIRFTHVSGAYGRKYLPETMGSGVAVIDYDSDEAPDLFFVNGTWWPDDPNGRDRGSAIPALYRNLGDGKFSDVTVETGLAEPMYGMGAAAGDIDNDGDTDLFVTALGADRLFRNDGGVFTEIANRVGIADPGFGTSAAFLDYDHDGDLDLFVCNYVEWTADTDIFCTLDGQSKSYCTPESYTGQSSRLYRNEGPARFTDVTRQAGVLNEAGKSLGVTVIDFNGDGWEDIAVANDTQPNYLYRNEGDGTFTDVGREAGIAFSEAGVARGAMGIDSADYDGSGRESIVIGNFSNEMIGLYHNEDGELFIDDAPRAGVGLPSLLTLAFGCFFFDHDLDGDQDILVANGHVENDINKVQHEIFHAQRPHLFRNLGNGTFDERIDRDDALAEAMVARGAAYLDHDGDGDLDVVLTTNNGPARLLRNEGGNRSAWIRVRLIGSSANRDAIGARVRAVAGGLTSSAIVKSGSSYCSQSELVATLGLGDAETIDRLEIDWPGGGTQTIVNPRIRSLVVVRQEDR